MKIVDCMQPVTALDEVYNSRGRNWRPVLLFGIRHVRCHGRWRGPVMEYKAGGCFGELALLYNSPRAASVVAREKCQLWTLELSVFEPYSQTRHLTAL